eukprot:jgi/Ulvmu1/12188/UM085_0052.1
MRLGFCKLKESPGRAKPTDSARVREQLVAFLDLHGNTLPDSISTALQAVAQELPIVCSTDAPREWGIEPRSSGASPAAKQYKGKVKKKKSKARGA